MKSEQIPGIIPQSKDFEARICTYNDIGSQYLAHAAAIMKSCSTAKPIYKRYFLNSRQIICSA